MIRVRDFWQMACPRCNGDSGLIITVEVQVRPVQDSANVESGVYGDGVWHEESPTNCEICTWEGTLGQAQLTLQSQKEAA